MTDYNEYLKSDAWKTIAREARARDGFRCRLCNSPHRLEVHHRTYERREKERPGDLTTLCHDCHGNYHGIKTGVDGIDMIELFLIGG